MTNTQTNELPNFTIYDQGELVTPTLNEQVLAIGNSAVTSFQAAGAVLLHNLGNVAAEGLKTVTTPVLLDIHDHMHGSHLRDEYFARKHELATAAMRESVGL
jgi:hypothetical protein